MFNKQTNQHRNEIQGCLNGKSSMWTQYVYRPPMDTHRWSETLQTCYIHTHMPLQLYVCYYMVALFWLLIILKGSFYASNAIFVVIISLFNYFQLSHPKTIIYMRRSSKSLHFSECRTWPGWYNLLYCFKDYSCSLEIQILACRCHFPDILRK